MISVLVVMLLAQGGSSGDNLDFSIYDYDGDISQSILRLYYGKTNIWRRQPQKCYGVLVNWRVGLFPCSCVAYTADDKMTSRPWKHVTPVVTQKVDKNLLTVGTMFEEYESRYGNHKVKVTKYMEGPRGTDTFTCKSDLIYEFAALELERRINYSTLIWFPTANWTVMRNLTEEILAYDTAASSRCKVVYWQEDVQKNARGSKQVNHKRVLKTVYLASFDTASTCKMTVCPSYDTLKNYSAKYHWEEDIVPKSSVEMKQDPKICDNHLQAHYRSCVGWNNGPYNNSICAVVPGTPVICGSDRYTGGIVGLITNATLFCPTESFGAAYATVNLVAEAMPLISKQLRIVNAPGYSDFYKNPLGGPSNLLVLGKSQTTAVSSCLVLVTSFSIFCLMTIAL